MIPTRCSGPAPFSISSRARRLARAFSSLYVHCTPLYTAAPRSGVRRTCASNSSWTVLFCGTSRTVSFHSYKIRRLSASSRSERSERLASGFSAIASSRLTQYPLQRLIDSRLKRAVLYSISKTRSPSSSAAVNVRSNFAV